MRKSLLILFLIALVPHGDLLAAGAPATYQEYFAANKLFSSSQFQEALTLYKKILADPRAGVPLKDIYTRIGDTCFRLGAYEDALTAYRAALGEQKASGGPDIQYWVGFCCMMLGRDAEAVSEFLKIPQRYPKSGMWVGTAYYWAAKASERLGRTEDAATYYRKAAGNGRSTQGKYALRKANEAVRHEK